MIVAGQVLRHTPVYVWLLLAYLVWQGLQALRPRSQPMWRMFVVPAVFIAAGLASLAAGPGGGAGPLATWVLAALAVVPLGYRTGPRLLAVDRRTGVVLRPGSVGPLVRNVVAFVLQYGIAVAMAMHLGGHGALLLAGRAVSGATAGYFLGWAAAAWGQYRAAPA